MQVEADRGLTEKTAEGLGEPMERQMASTSVNACAAAADRACYPGDPLHDRQTTNRMKSSSVSPADLPQPGFGKTNCPKY